VPEEVRRSEVVACRLTPSEKAALDRLCGLRGLRPAVLLAALVDEEHQRLLRQQARARTGCEHSGVIGPRRVCVSCGEAQG
jgi:hypothetical protein